MAVDGSGNYVKCRSNGNGGWIVEEMTARSYRRASKDVLEEWIVQTYSQDRLTEPPPVTEDKELLKWKPARDWARKALEYGIPEVAIPLGMAQKKVMSYKAIKPSAFVFQTPQQHEAFERALEKFQNRNGCGLEILALRRSYGDRRQGSLCDLAGDVLQLIRAGDHDFTGGLNLTRRFATLGEIAETRLDEIESRKQAAEQELFRAMEHASCRKTARRRATSSHAKTSS